MQTTPEFNDAVGELEGAAYGLAGALEDVRAAAEQPARGDVTRLGRNVEKQANAYLRASEAVGTAIARAAYGRVDEDAVARMSASIGLDLKVAEQLEAHARLEGSDESDEIGGVAIAFALRGAGPDEVDAIKQTRSLLLVLSPVLHEIRGVEDPAARTLFATPVSPPANAGAPSVDGAIDKILSAGGTAIAASVSTVAPPDVALIVTSIASFSGPKASEAAREVIGRLNQILHPLARAAAEVLALVIKKIKAIVGSDHLDRLLGDAQQCLVNRWNDLKDDNPAGLALGLLLDQQAVKATCATKLDTLDPAKASDVAQACDAIASAHGKRSGYVGYGNWVLGVAAVRVIGRSPQGVLLLSLVALALIGYSVWLAQDYLDAERLNFLPNRVLGVRGAVMAA